MRRKQYTNSIARHVIEMAVYVSVLTEAHHRASDLSTDIYVLTSMLGRRSAEVNASKPV